ncbi:MAG: SAM-dependent DNA methyltransferase, partial [Dehalococcoidia bacterium]
FRPLRKNLGKKNCELSAEDIQRIVAGFNAFEETEQSKIFPNEAFGYARITVERPLRLRVDLSPAGRARFRKACAESGEEPLATLVDQLAERLGPGPHNDFNRFLTDAEQEAARAGAKLTAKRQKLLQTALAERDETAAPVIKRILKQGKVEAGSLQGRFELSADGKRSVVVYEPDSELRDTEQVPLLEEGGVEAFFRREVLPHVPDAWIDESATRIGYEVSFTRYFYKPQPLRTLEEIRADIEALERETEGLLEEALVETGTVSER